MKLIIAHPTGNAFVRAAVNGMYDAGILAAFYTAIASFPGTFLDGLGVIGPLSEIRRRRVDARLKPYTHLSPWREAGRLVALKTGLTSFTTHETGIFSIDAIYKSLDREVAAYMRKYANANAIYAYEDAAGYSFRQAKILGLKCLYDLPIGYWRAGHELLKNEAARWPEWAATLTTFKDSEIKLARKDQELKLADRIFVASSFTAKTLNAYPGILAPVKVIPYGFPVVGAIKEYDNVTGRPLKLLFVGGLSQRKGIADLFAAVNKLGRHVELTIVGSKTGNDCPALDTELARHKWIPSLPHAGILKIMKEHDVLVFPSLFEGFGLVITEAMAQGTPVITTERTAGPDVIEHDNNGWLIKAGDEQDIQHAIEKLLQQPQLIANAGKAAMETARLRPWHVYGKELAEAIIYNNY
ncbi:MAG: glycosyl transferase family 1 [Mucilaginibacter sp.]|nr:glycosyl transferase family 1 [Mucilaginibacter sp.]